MPIYEYISPKGEVIEEFMTMSEDHPDQIERDGVTYQRVWGVTRTGADRDCDQYPYHSLRLAGKISEKDAQHGDAIVRGCKHENVPLIRSRQHERELEAKYGLKRD